MSSQIYQASANKPRLGENRSVLIYRYSDAMCETCVFEDLTELQTFQETIGKDNILVLSAYPNDRNGRIRAANELAYFNHRNISMDSLIVPMSETDGHKRYFALINEKGDIEMAFFPRRGKPELTRMYFKEIGKRLKTK
jgi:hypothetical protein